MSLVFFERSCVAQKALALADDPDFKNGVKLYKAGDSAGALASFRRAAAGRPNDPNLLFEIAQVLADQGSMREAESSYLSAIELFQQLQGHSTGSGVSYKLNIGMSWNNLAVVYS